MASRLIADRTGRQAIAAMAPSGKVPDGRAAVEAGLAWQCLPPDRLVETVVDLARAAVGSDPDLVRRVKATLGLSLALVDPAEAVALELEAPLVEGATSICRLSRASARPGPHQDNDAEGISQ